MYCSFWLAGSTASSYLQEENRVLRAGLRGKRLRLSDDDRRRLAVKAQALGREALAQIASVDTPATLLRWYCYLIAAKYDGSKNRSPGRPPTAKDIRELMVCVARENPMWGYTRLRGAVPSIYSSASPWAGSQPCSAKYPGFCADSKGVYAADLWSISKGPSFGTGRDGDARRSVRSIPRIISRDSP